MMDIRGLAYIIVEHEDPVQWARFGEGVLGMQAARSTDDDVWLKMDERAFRLAAVRGHDNRYFASGWEVADEAAFATAAQALEDSRTPYSRADATDRERRSVIDMLWFRDPSGNRHEVALGFKTDFARFASPTGTQFITGALGLGHVALPCPNFDATWEFMRKVMGFGMSDFMVHRPAPTGPATRIYFLHCHNGRHHSLAIADMPVPSGCVHMMVEVPDMDEVGRAMDRRQAYGARLMATLGRHVNDRMTSFYMQTPSAFALEYGYGGLVLDWNENVVHETTRVSLWGHDFSIGF